MALVPQRNLPLLVPPAAVAIGNELYERVGRPLYDQLAARAADRAREFMDGATDEMPNVRGGQGRVYSRPPPVTPPRKRKQTEPRTQEPRKRTTTLRSTGSRSGPSARHIMPYRRRRRNIRRRPRRRRVRKLSRMRPHRRRASNRVHKYGKGRAWKFRGMALPNRALVQHRFFSRYALKDDAHAVNADWDDRGDHNRHQIAKIRINDIHLPMASSYADGAAGESHTNDLNSCKFTDIFKSLYRKYRVYKLRVTIVLKNNGTDTQSGMVYFIPCKDGEGEVHPDTQLQVLNRRLPHKRFRVGATLRQAKFTYEIATHQAEQIKKLFFVTDDGYTGTGGTEGGTLSSPTKIPTISCGILLDQGQTAPDPGFMMYEIYLNYKTVWYEQPQAQGMQDADDTIHTTDT